MTSSYKYNNISDLKVGDTDVNIFGVVKYFSRPSRTKNGQYSALYTVVDPSVKDDIENGIRCNLFECQEKLLPAVDNVGDIIRLHRMKVTKFNGRLQIQRTKGSSWLVRHSCSIYIYTYLFIYLFTFEPVQKFVLFF